MKHTTQWVAALITVASAGFAMGCGCSSNNVRLEPVREQIISPNVCSVQEPVLINRTRYVTETPSRTFWTAPSKENPAYVIGNVFTAPFRAITGRSLGQPDVVASYDYRQPILQPVGERLTTVTTKSTGCTCSKKYHLTRKVSYHCDSMLMPVGEQVTTVKVIRTKPMPMPVCERLTTVKVIHNPCLQPVGELNTSCGCSEPIMPQPVGERIITRTYVNPWNSCDF